MALLLVLHCRLRDRAWLPTTPTHGAYTLDTTTSPSRKTTTNGTYSGFQTGLRVQNRWGLSGELDYTWSHEIDIQTYDNTCCISNPWYTKYDKGSGFLDRRNMLSANYIYNLPFFTKSSGLVKSLLGGWQIAGTIIDESGVPVATTLSGNDTIGLGGGYQNRPNVAGKVHYTKKVAEWFNTARVLPSVGSLERWTEPGLR